MPAGHFVEYSFPVSDEDIYQVNPHRLSSRPRQRTVSVSSSIYSKIIPEMPRVKPASPVVSQPGLNSAYGSFTIPGHASHSLKSMMSHLPHSHHNRLERHSLTRKASQDSQYSSDNNMPSTPHSPLSIHSAFDVRLPMNRTPSSSSMEDPYAPSSTHYFHRRQSSAESSQMHPILESMERRSRLSGRNVCATCKKPGYNYPRCGKCGETWCSRDCRLMNPFTPSITHLSRIIGTTVVIIGCIKLASRAFSRNISAVPPDVLKLHSSEQHSGRLDLIGPREAEA